jgi:hypothetical protein
MVDTSLEFPPRNMMTLHSISNLDPMVGKQSEAPSLDLLVEI